MLAMLDEALERALPKTQCREARVVEAMRYALLGGGKRVRAQLAMRFCEACGGAAADALPFACAVEMIQAYSLIHDDLPCMDDDDLRRGKPSCHKVFGEATALLAGDALQSLAFETVAGAENLSAGARLAAVTELARCIGMHGMVGGQTIDMEYENTPCGEDVLCDLQGKKTGALMQASCVLGCLAGGGSRAALEAAARYAGALGRAFQIVDDLLDATATTEQLGKPAGSDARQQKSTFVSVLGVETAMERVRVFTNEAISATIPFGEKGRPLAELAQALAVRLQ